MARHQSGISSGSESDRSSDSWCLGNGTAGNSCSTPGYVPVTATDSRTCSQWFAPGAKQIIVGYVDRIFASVKSANYSSRVRW